MLATLGWALLMMNIPPTVIIAPIAVEISGSMGRERKRLREGHYG